MSIWVGRPGLTINSLFVLALVLTLINPLTVWDAGFQLSFMAMLGLLVLVSPLERSLFGLLQGRLKSERAGLTIGLSQ